MNNQLFLLFENKYNLFDVKVNGFQVWPYIRFSTYMKIEEMANHQQKRKTPQKRPGVQEIVSIIYNCTYKNPLLYKTKHKYLIVEHARKLLVDNKYECIYTNELADILGNKAVSAEFLYEGKHLYPSRVNNPLCLDYIDIAPGITRGVLEIKYKNELKEIAQFSKKVSGFIAEWFNVDIEPEYINNMAAKRFIWHHEKIKLFAKLLRNISPEIIIEVVGYETDKMILNEAAHQLGIRVIELQHGVLSTGHIAYNYLNKVEYSYLPDFYFLFSDFWKTAASFPVEDQKLVSVGYPYLDRMLEKYKEDDYKQESLTIIVLSQPEYSIKLQENVLTLIECLDTRSVKYKIIYKLHPAEYRLSSNNFSDLREKSQIEVIDSSNKNLYELFSEADIQIGVTSTAIYEGLAYGLGTYLFHFEKTDEYMGELCRCGAASLFNSPQEMAAEIDKDSSKKRNSNMREVFFKPNALANIQQELDKLI